MLQARRVIGFALFGLVPLALLMTPGAGAAAYSATASVRTTTQYLGDGAPGTLFMFTINNTGTSAGIGAVEIARPGNAWTITSCPVAPFGWSPQTSDTKCRYRSKSTSADDIKPGTSSHLFAARATTLPGTEDRVGDWPVTVSRTNDFSKPNTITPAPAPTPGALTLTAHSFQVLDAGIAAGAAAPGDACPTLSREAVTGTSQDVVVCGRNRTTGTLTPSAIHSSIAGTWIGTAGTFSSGPVAPTSTSVVLGTWSATAITNVFGEDKTVVAAVGSASNQTSPSTTFIGYHATNRPPVASAGTATTVEDGSASGIVLSATDDDGNPVTFAIDTGPAQGSLGAISAVTCNGSTPNSCSATVDYTPNADYFGADSFTYTANDGHTDSAPATIGITVNAVNDAPSFTKGANEAVLEDAGAQSVAGWATGISTGPANESGQSVSFVVSNDNNALFSAQPAVSATGTLTYTTAANANGSATVSVYAQDDGGTANGGADTSGTQTFTITAASVNDAPSYTKGADQTVLEDSGAQTVSGWATALTRGPSDEAAQTLTFLISSDNPGLFSTQPAINASTGTLTYTPGPDQYGTSTITATIKDDGGTANGGVDSSSQTFSITVNPVNDEPSFTKGANVTVDEDSGAKTVSAWATDLAAGPFEPQMLTFNVSADNPGLFSVQPTVNGKTGDLAFTPAGNAYGSTTVTISVSDDGGTAFGGDDTSPDQTFTITVTSVNDNPSFTAGANQTVNEDAGAQSVPNWATDISPGPNETGTVTFSITANDNTGLFSAAPAVSNTGTLTYTPAANASGVANLTVTASDGEGGTAAHDFTITVNAVNDEPTFTKGADDTAVVDSGAQTVSGWATNITAGPADESAQALTFTLVADDPTLFTTQPAVNASTGDLTYTPGSTTGSSTVTVTLSDDGGTANGGDDSSTQTFVITLIPPNEAPVAQATSATGNEDGGAITVTLTGTDADDDNLTFDVGTASNGLVTVPGTVDCTTVANTCTTTVTYTPNANFYGADSFTYKVNDGTVDSAAATASMTVNAVNDVPSFTKGADQSVAEDAGAQTVSGWATAISAGPSNESTQTVTIERVSTTNDALFSALPAVDASTGNLTYTPAANANGSATVTLRAKDDGGTANGGVDTSANQTFTITVTAVNDAPVATDDAATIDEDTFVSVSVKANDTDVDLDTLSITAFDGTSTQGATVTDNGDGTLKYNPAGQFDDMQVDAGNRTDTFTYTVSDGNGGTDTATVTITVTPVNDPPVAVATSQTLIGNTLHAVSTTGTGPHTTGTGELDAGVIDPDDTVFTVTAGTFASTNVGTASVAADGTYTFLPPQGFTGSDTFTFTVNDAHGGSDTETATMTVSNMVWYVNNAAGTAGDGRSTSPFNTIAPLHTGGSADAKDGAGDHIFVYQGTGAYTGGLLLEGTQKLWGEPKGLVVASKTLVAAGGSNPTLNGGLTLANNTDVQGVNLGAHAGMALRGTSVGTSTVGTTTPVAVNNPGGGGVSLNGGTPTITLSKLTTSGGTHGIDLLSLGGTVTVNDASSSISSPTTAGVSAANSSTNLTYAGSVTTSGAARSVSVSGHTAAVSLSGTVTDGGAGILLNNNPGASISLSGPLALTTTSNAGFTATTSGTVTAAHVDNAVTTTSGTAVNIANTTIGTGGVSFRSVNVNTAGAGGPANGIIVNNTGTAGSFRVLGSGTAGSGGLVRATTGNGVSLTSTKGVSLGHVKIQDTGAHGIQGTSVNGLTLSGVEIPGAGDADNERAVDLTNTSGVLTISGGSYSDAADDLVKVANTNTNVTVNVNNAAQFKDLTTTFANNALQFVPDGTSVINANVSGSTFSNLKNSSVNWGSSALSSSGSSTLSFTGNTVNGGAAGGAGILLSGQENTATNVTISNNSFTGAGGNGVVNHDVNDNSTVLATITNNTFSSPIGHAIVGAVDEDGDIRMRIDGNTITNAGGDGIQLTNFGDDSVSAMTSTAHFIVRNNSVNGHSSNPAVQFVGGVGIFHFESDADTTCAAVTGNSVSGTPGGFSDIYLQDSSGAAKFKYEEAPNTASTGTATASYVQSLNASTTLANIYSDATLSDGVTCLAP